MSGRCRHPERDVFPLKWRPVSEDAYRAGYVISSMKPGTMRWTFAGNDQPQALWCRRCRSWLPLGHSDETPERVAVEIMAAGIVADLDSFGCTDGDTQTCPGCGWADYDTDDVPPTPQREAGWLARVIATHKETP